MSLETIVLPAPIRGSGENLKIVSLSARHGSGPGLSIILPSLTEKNIKINFCSL